MPPPDLLKRICCHPTSSCGEPLPFHPARGSQWTVRLLRSAGDGLRSRGRCRPRCSGGWSRGIERKLRLGRRERNAVVGRSERADDHAPDGLNQSRSRSARFRVRGETGSHRIVEKRSGLLRTFSASSPLAAAALPPIEQHRDRHGGGRLGRSVIETRPRPGELTRPRSRGLVRR